ncbi:MULTISPECIES: ankyrin repeat domain-containing protein [unclassified Wolbachia]|uniref:ankyrin repeat domain-containing protein n=1 Tax=unclassified Wolbachia TaxID=2640676 RepID=UPI00221E6A3F|nr:MULTISPECIES: ankyrin repeat domain-containing protein [unclassified Wolbachia]
MRKYRIEELRNKLFIAINKLDFEKVKRCVRKAKIKGVQNDIINGKQYGMAPIHFATYRANSKILQFLINNGARVNAVSDACIVPSVSIVVTYDMEKVVFDCIHGNTSFQGMQNFTALHLALYQCRLDIAKVLLDNNIDINIRSTNGKIAFEVIPGYESLCSDGCDIKKIFLAVLRFHKNNCTELLLSARINTKLELEAGDTPDPEPSSAVKPFSFINSIFSWVTTATLSSLFSSAHALPSAQQSVDHFAGSPIGSSQVDFNSTALLTDVMIRKFTEKKYSRPLEDSLLTIQEIRERRLNTIEKNFETALSKCEKLYQHPESSLSNLTIPKGMHQKSL